MIAGRAGRFSVPLVLLAVLFLVLLVLAGCYYPEGF